jgi:hypothetical protein
MLKLESVRIVRDFPIHLDFELTPISMGIGFSGLLLQSPVCFVSVQVCQMPIEGKESEKGAENRRQRHDPLNHYMSDQQCDLGRPPQRDCHASNWESAMTEASGWRRRKASGFSGNVRCRGRVSRRRAGGVDNDGMTMAGA